GRRPHGATPTEARQQGCLGNPRDRNLPSVDSRPGRSSYPQAASFPRRRRNGAASAVAGKHRLLTVRRDRTVLRPAFRIRGAAPKNRLLTVPPTPTAPSAVSNRRRAPTATCQRAPSPSGFALPPWLLFALRQSRGSSVGCAKLCQLI